MQRQKPPTAIALVIVGLLAAAANLAPTLTPDEKDEKLQAPELVSRHLQSIGPSDALAARKTCTAEGVGRLRVLVGGSGAIEGPAHLVSDGRQVAFSISFGLSDYPAETFAYDGRGANVGMLGPGRRSRLGQFLYLYKEIVAEGLLGGTLSTAWPLSDVKGRGPRLQYKGLKKVAGHELHELTYQFKRGGGDLEIALYFLEESARHVRTTYRLRIPAQIGLGPEQSASQRDSRFSLEERFDAFTEVQGLNLPTRWVIQLNAEGSQGSSVTEWETTFQRIGFNQPIDPNHFAIR